MAELSQSGDADRTLAQPSPDAQHPTEIAMHRAALLLNEAIADALGTARLPNSSRLALSGGYCDNPAWLCCRPAGDTGDVVGTVVGIVGNLSGLDNMVVELDRPLPYRVLVDDSSSCREPVAEKAGVATHVVLVLRYAKAQWLPSETVGLYMLDEFPAHDTQLGELPSAAVHAESHAVYRVLR